MIEMSPVAIRIVMLRGSRVPSAGCEIIHKAREYQSSTPVVTPGFPLEVGEGRSICSPPTCRPADTIDSFLRVRPPDARSH